MTDVYEHGSLVVRGSIDAQGGFLNKGSAVGTILVQYGTDAGKSAAAAGNKGYVYFATDTGSIYQSDGTTWNKIFTVITTS